MGRPKIKSEIADVPKRKEYEMVQVNNIILNILSANFQEFKITKYNIGVSSDRTRIVLTAVIDTPFPTFEDIKTAKLKDNENSNSSDK